MNEIYSTAEKAGVFDLLDAVKALSVSWTTLCRSFFHREI